MGCRTYQLAFQSAKTITPTTTSQVAVSSGYYTGGAVTVAGDSNLVADNIKSGVSIFGVSGSYVGTGSSGGDTSTEDAIITRTLTEYTNDRVSLIGENTFYKCSSLISVNFPAVTTICSGAFQQCSSLTSISFPAVNNISNYAFSNCYNLVSIDLPAAIYIGANAFARCSKLTTVILPVVQEIWAQAFMSCSSLTTVSLSATNVIRDSAFAYCYNLISLYLNGSSICTLSKSTALYSTPIGGYSKSAGRYGSIFVPASLLASYKAATNWTYFSSRFVGI